MNAIDLGLFGGPGGWAQGARALGITEVGIELDAAACATRAAAGHPTIRADVAAFPVDQLAGQVRGLSASPPCTTFSAAGKRAGVAVTDILAGLIRDLLVGKDTRAEHRREMGRVLHAATPLRPTLGRRAHRIATAIRSAALVAEPARFIAACHPEWIALEQVPAVLPLWQVYAAELRRMGYSVWTGKLNAADYGVPQTRERAILIASRVRKVQRPEPTHYDPRKGMQLWGTPWVSMAEALGWGATGRPSVSVTAGGTSTGGAEPFGHRGRDALEAEQDAGRWLLHTNRDQRPDGSRQTADPRSAPAPAPALTAKSGGQWIVKPAEDRPAWVHGRPSTTVCADSRIGRPGHKGRESGGESFYAVDSVRITVQEAAILQSFRPDYPWQGTKTAQFTQVGNAVPPLLAEHVLAMAAGIARMERAA